MYRKLGNTTAGFRCIRYANDLTLTAALVKPSQRFADGKAHALK
jgi:hypothetical protein